MINKETKAATVVRTPLISFVVLFSHLLDLEEFNALVWSDKVGGPKKKQIV